MASHTYSWQNDVVRPGLQVVVLGRGTKKELVKTGPKVRRAREEMQLQ